MRSTSWSALISREKMPTGVWCRLAVLLAISRARAVLPTEGRAAIIMRSEFWKPPKISSRDLKPVGTPRNSCYAEESFSQFARFIKPKMREKFRSFNELTHHKFFHHDFGVMFGVSRRRHRGGKFGQIRSAADTLK